MSPSYHHLESRGFLVVPGFLPESVLGQLRDDYARQPLAANRNYGLSMPSPYATATVLPLVRDVLRDVQAQTNLKPDAPAGAAYFATGRGVNFAWHQDHESFFSQQNHYDYLNFYVPIIKPRPDKSNLSIVPFDVLERECPKTYRRVVRGGAARFIRVGTRRLVFCDDVGTVHLMRRDIEALAETPPLSAGDLLLLRGDMIHRTQDADTDRVALSLRASSSGTIVRRRQLARGSWHKARMMARNAATYQHMFETFERAHRDEMPLDELSALMRASAEPAPKGERQFLKMLLAEKRRAHVLGRFFPKVVVDAVASQVVSMYERYGSPASSRKNERPQDERRA